jgi:hypothetical protein
VSWGLACPQERNETYDLAKRGPWEEQKLPSSKTLKESLGHRLTFDLDIYEAWLIKTNVNMPIDMPQIGQDNFGKQCHGVWHVPKKEMRHMIKPRGTLGRNKNFFYQRL